MEAQLDQALATLNGNWPAIPAVPLREEPVLNASEASHQSPARGPRPPAPAVVRRSDGDKYLLIEYGPNVLDLNLRFRVHALESGLRAENLAGIIDITPGVRSLHIHYDSRRLPRETLLAALDSVERRIPDLDDIVVPSRIVHLPLSWDDPATQLAIRKYTQSVRPDAPWAPATSNSSAASTASTPSTTSTASSSTPVTWCSAWAMSTWARPSPPPSTRATAWSPPSTIRRAPGRPKMPSVSAALTCAFMAWRVPAATSSSAAPCRCGTPTTPTRPWLLRFFDQIRFYPVSAAELLEIRDAFPHGGYPLRIESQDFRLRDYHAFLRSIEAGSASFKRTQQEAFLAERERWAASGLDTYREPPDVAAPAGSGDAVPEGCRAVTSPVTASVWNIAVAPGQRVEAGDRLLVLEAMKMEIAVAAPFPGTVETLHCAAGALVFAGQNLVTVRQEVAA